MKSLWLAQNELRNNYIQQSSKDKTDHPHILTINKIQQQHSPTKKAKRFRSAFTTDQVHYLEKQFKKFPYIGNTHRRDVAIALNIPERAVKIWFQNRRMKEKKETSTKECDEEQCKRKSVEISKEQLHNAVEQSVNDRKVTLIKETKMSVVENKNSVDQSEYTLKLDKVNKSVNAHISTGFHDNKSDCNVIADTSIDLCQNYKRESSNNSKDMISEQTTKPPVFLPVEQTFPMDLSFPKANNISRPHEDTLTSSVPETVPNVVNTPEYARVSPSLSPIYAQPYITSSGVVWKPINLLSVVPSGLPGLPTGPVQFSANSSEKAGSCNCNCHVKSPTSVTLQQNASNPQYIITAVPYKNPSTNF